MTTMTLTRATAFDMMHPAASTRPGDAFKRCFDVVASVCALAALAPLLAVVALCICAADRGSPIFTQTRVGKNGREFRFYKFRSMVKCADGMKVDLMRQNAHGDQRTFKMLKDPRVTRIGAWIRRASIDELPQLWNILVGDMSFVGPRPAIPSELALYTPSDRRRIAVVPGLTCIWQVSGRGELAFPEQVELDVEYIRTRSLLGDLVLIARTVPAVLGARGAY